MEDEDDDDEVDDADDESVDDVDAEECAKAKEAEENTEGEGDVVATGVARAGVGTRGKTSTKSGLARAESRGTSPRREEEGREERANPDAGRKRALCIEVRR